MIVAHTLQAQKGPSLLTMLLGLRSLWCASSQRALQWGRMLQALSLSAQQP